MIHKLYTDGTAVFGMLFPVLFLIALATLSFIINDLLCRTLGVARPDSEKIANAIQDLSTIATLTGSLQTIISLCIVGFSMWFGTMQVGTKAFALLVQGFASTGFGITVAIIGQVYLDMFHRTAKKEES